MNNIQRGLTMALLALGALVAQAGQYWWAGDGVNLGGSGTWDTSSNKWRNGSESGAFTAWPNSGSDEALFTNAVGGTAGTVTLSGTISANALSFKTNAWTLTGGTLNLGSGASTITVANSTASSHQTINSTLAGSGTLTVSGKATYGFGLLLNANNSAYTGKVVVDQTGSYFGLAVTNDNALGAVAATYTPDAITLKNGTLLVNDAAVTVSLATNRGITFQSGGGLIFNRNGGGSFALNSPLAGSGNITCRGGTTFLVNSTNNTYTGQFVVYVDSANTTVKPGADNVFSHGPSVSSFYITRWNGSTALLDLNGYSQILPALSWAGNGGATTRVIDNLASGKTVTLTLGDNNGSSSFDGCIRNTAGTLSLSKVGTGTQTLTGTNAYAGATTISGGTLLADLGKSNGIDIRTNVLPSVSALVLGGGTLSVKGATTGASLQTMGNLSITSYGVLSITPNGGTGTTLALGNTWTRTVGGTLLADLSAAGSTLSSSPTLTNGIIGGYAFVKDGTGTGFATASGGNVVRYTGATTLDAVTASNTLDGTVNYAVSTNVQLAAAGTTQTLHSVLISKADPALHIQSKTLVVGSGGVLFTSTAWSSINGWTGATITSGSGDLVVNVSGSGGADLYTPLVDNGARSVGLTKTGSDTLFLDAGNSYSGDTVINQGTIIRPQHIPNGAGKGNLVVNANGTLDLQGANGTVNGLRNSDAVGGQVKNTYTGPATLTVGNANADGVFGGTLSDSGANTLALVKIGSGTQVLSGNNTYRGGTTLSNGVLSISGVANVGGATNRLTFAGGTLRITGTALTSLSSNEVNWATFSGGLDIANAGYTFVITNALGSGTVLAKTGAGTLSLTGPQAGTINTDDPSKVSFGAGLGFYNFGLTSGGVLSPAGSGTIGAFAVNSNLTLAGKLLVDVTASSSDTVTAGGSITLSAGATLEIVNPSLLDRSRQYEIMTAVGPVSGTFASSNLPARWKVSVVGNKVVLYYAYPGTIIRVL
jgi:autotransporter-associated beta strand protein